MEISYIGEYQLGNLISNQVPFLYFSLVADIVDADHPLLSGVQVQDIDGLLAVVEEKSKDPQYPIVLICEDGSLSKQAAGTLAVAGYVNVFVVEGGLNGLN